MMSGIRMTASTIHLRSPARRRTLRADPLVVVLLAAAVAGLVALWVALAAAAPGAGARPAPRVALVVDAGGGSDAALAAARAAAERSPERADVAVRVPRSPIEAATDVRYFAAQRYGTVVAVGPVSGAAAQAAAGEYPRTRFVLRARVPRVVR
jgi:basic membrane lipoprotein Med (substrate-binding protein (PBP1-ABC) superfamily)